MCQEHRWAPASELEFIVHTVTTMSMPQAERVLPQLVRSREPAHAEGGISGPLAQGPHYREQQTAPATTPASSQGITQALRELRSVVPLPRRLLHDMVTSKSEGVQIISRNQPDAKGLRLQTLGLDPRRNLAADADAASDPDGALDGVAAVGLRGFCCCGAAAGLLLGHEATAVGCPHFLAAVGCL